MMNEPFIHIFENYNDYYLYDVNTNRILKLEKHIYEQLSLLKTGSGKDIKKLCEENSMIKNMVDSGLLSSNRVAEVSHPDEEILFDIVSRNLKNLTLQITQECNLRCNYCVYSGGYDNRSHTSKKMAYDTAKQAIDYIIEHSVDSDVLNIGFYGGEPLLEFQFIKKCIEYTEAKTEGKDVFFNLTTNGTIINDEIVKYFLDHNVSIMISIDGPKDIHDSNRKFKINNCGSFDKINENLTFIKDNYPEYLKNVKYNVVLDPRVDVTCANKFFANHEVIGDTFLRVSQISNNYAKEKISAANKYIMSWNYELFKSFLGELNRIDPEYVPKLTMPYIYKLKSDFHYNRETSKKLGKQSLHGGACIPGIGKLFVSTDGTFYPCERVSEASEIMKIGNVDEGLDLEKIKKLLGIGKLTEEKCKSCWAFRFCYLCLAFVDGFDKLSTEKKMSKCEQVRKHTEESLKDYCALKKFYNDFAAYNELESLTS